MTGDTELTARLSAAEQGSTAAMRELASALLVGIDGVRDVKGGVDWLERAAMSGDCDAMERLATITAVGVTNPPDWTRALDLMERAAELGSVRAQDQLRLLAISDPEVDTTWAELRAAIDLGPWMSAPSRTPLIESPRVRLAKDFASPEVCDWLVSRARGRLRPGLMYDGVTRTAQIDPHRTCSDYQFDILNTDLIVQLVRERIAETTRLPTAFMEPPRIFHYALGEDIKAHFDRASDGVSGYAGGDYRGDRIVTFLLYLNDDFDGGDLSFPRVDFQCRGGKGDGVYFAHVDLDGKQDPLSLHAGLVVTRGEKWVMSQWIHDRPFGATVDPL